MSAIQSLPLLKPIPLAVVLSFLSYLLIGGYSCFARSKKALAAEVSLSRVQNKEAIEIGVSEEARNKIKLSWSDINRHVHVLGQPGMGKSVFLRNIYADSILNGKGLMMIDLKADLDVKSEILELSRIAKREDDLYIIDLSDPKHSIGYNPLLRGNASELKDKIMNSLDWSEVFYEKMAENTLLMLMRGFVALRDQPASHTTRSLTPTLMDLCECLKYPASIELLASKLSPDNVLIARELRELAVELKDKSNFKAIQGIRTDIEVMVKSEWGALLEKPDSIDLLDAFLKKKIVFVELDGQTYKKTATRLARMLISDIQTVSGHIVTKVSLAQRPKVTVIVDEFAQIVSDEKMADSFAEILNRCRGSGIGVVIAHQSLGDFTSPRACTRILDTTAITVAFAQKDPESCDRLAQVAGTKESEAYTEQVESGFFGRGPAGTGSMRITQEYIIHPNVFKNLSVGKAVFMSKSPSINVVMKVKKLEVPAFTGVWPRPQNRSITAPAKELLNLQAARLASKAGAFKSFESRFEEASQADI